MLLFSLAWLSNGAEGNLLKNGQTISIDNRRLAAFREVGVPIRTRPATASEITQANKQNKFSEGVSGSDTIRITGGGAVNMIINVVEGLPKLNVRPLASVICDSPRIIVEANDEQESRIRLTFFRIKQ